MDDSTPRPNLENIVAFTVCINFADKLRFSLSYNLAVIKHIYVITDIHDSETISLCKEFNVATILTNKVYQNGARFNKSGLIYDTQKLLHQKYPRHWMLYFDADTIFPMNFARILSSYVSFDKSYIYGIQRAVYNTQEDFDNERIAAVTHAVGFFQLYFDKKKYYPAFSINCGECDDFFEKKFLSKIQLDGLCSHLGSTNLDWDGRKSRLW
jgi:hypothetical protein